MSQIEDFYPLSPMQEGMLFHTLVAPDSGVYINQVSLTFQGELDITSLERSWQLVVERHAALRTFFVWEGLESPIQVVEREVELPITHHDWQHLSESVWRRRLQAYTRAERTQGFDLTQAPLMRLGVLRLPGRLCLIVWSFHHVILDGWSVSLVLKEVEAIYRALGSGREPQLPPVRPFRDYIVWLQRQDLRLAEEYWRSVLRGFTSPTSLPADGEAGRGSRALEGYAGQRMLLTAKATSALAAWGRRVGLTLNTLFQGAWALLLSRYSGQSDVVFGNAVLGRAADLPGSEFIVGLFINTLLVRVGTATDASLLPWLQELQGNWAQARRFEHSPLIQVQGWSEVPRGVPLFESVVSFGSFSHRPGRSLREAPNSGAPTWDMETTGQTNVPISIDIAPGVELGLYLRYDRARFGDAFIRRILGHLTTLLESLPGDPRRHLSDLLFLPAPERQQVLLEWNDTVVPRFGPTLLQAPFEAWARTAPEAVALICGHVSLTYGELDMLTNILARRLQALGVGPESRVGVFMERSLDLVVALFAVLKAGGAYLPLDPEYPAERLAFMLADSGVSLVLTQNALGGKLPAHGARLLEVELEGLRAAAPAGKLFTSGVTPDNLAYVIYTSGSTGRPKGVMVSHRAICNRLEWMQETYRLTREDRVLQKTPFSFDVSVWEFFWPLSTGAKLVLAPPDGHRDPTRLLELIARERITTVHFVPSMLHFFLETPGLEAAACLERVICSGEALGFELQERFYKRLPASLHNLYGPTEAAVDVTFWECERDDRRRTVPIGRPIANTCIHLLDGGLRPVPIGVAAELHIGGVGLARGYLDRAGLTAERFVPDAFAATPGERLYKTGDLARWLPDGSIEYLGRIDQQVKVRGIRIELGEIEDVLGNHPTVRQVAVAAWEDGPAGKRLIAYVVAQPGAAVTADELRSLARERLPEPMVPSAVVFLEALPLTPSGKLDRRALPTPAPNHSSPRGPEFVPPRDELESELVEIWEEVLHACPIGVKDNFFASGGHSLLALRLMGMIQKRFDQELPLALLVEGGTIEQLASALRGSRNASRPWSPLVSLQPAGERPPFFCIHPIGGQVLCYADLARHLGEDQPFYGLQAVRLDEVGETAPAIEEMAAAYLAAVREVQPEGPYLLGGWSMGGILAFEMARQLHARGETAALVAILDAWSPVIHRIVPDDAYLLYEIVKDQSLQKGLEPAVSYEQLRDLDSEARLHRVLEEGRKAGLVSADVEVSWLRRFLQGYRARREALQRYTPAAFAGRLTLFRAAQEDTGFLRPLELEVGIDVHDPTLGWSAFSTEPVALRVVDGNHSTMCMEPNAPKLAQALRSAIASSLPEKPWQGSAAAGVRTSLSDPSTTGQGGPL